jgi:hypothetical protein
MSKERFNHRKEKEEISGLWTEWLLQMEVLSCVEEQRKT